MYTKNNTNRKSTTTSKDLINYNSYSYKSKSNPKVLAKASSYKSNAPKIKPKQLYPKNDVMYNIAMNNIVKFQDHISTQSQKIPNCLSMSNIEEIEVQGNGQNDNNLNLNINLNESNDLIMQSYQIEAQENKKVPMKRNNNTTITTNTINEQEYMCNNNNTIKMNDRKLLYTLRSLDLENLFTAFNLNSITFNDLFLLSKEDLVELNIPLGPRNRLLRFAEEYKRYAKEYDYKELTDFFQRNKCYLINQVKDFSCSNLPLSTIPLPVHNNISVLLSPKINSRQPSIIPSEDKKRNCNDLNKNYHDDHRENYSVCHNEDIIEDFNTSIINTTNYKENKSNRNKHDKMKEVNRSYNMNHYNKQQQKTQPNHEGLERYNNNNNIFSTNRSILKCSTGINSKNSNSNTKRIINNYDKAVNQIINPNIIEDNTSITSLQMPPYNGPPQSLNQSNISSSKNNNNNANNNHLNTIFSLNSNTISQNHNQSQSIPLTIANIEEPHPTNDNDHNESSSMTYYNDKLNMPSKSDLSANTIFTKNSIATANEKVKNQTIFMQNFQNIFIEVEQFQEQYENMKQKNDQRKTKMNNLMMKKKDNNTNSNVVLKAPNVKEQPKQYQISLGKEDLFSESERNLNHELNKLYETTSNDLKNNPSRQRYYGMNDTNDNDSNNEHIDNLKLKRQYHHRTNYNQQNHLHLQSQNSLYESECNTLK